MSLDVRNAVTLSYEDGLPSQSFIVKNRSYISLWGCKDGNLHRNKNYQDV